MAARPRIRARRGWPRGLREPRPGYYTWEPPADALPHLETAPPAGGVFTLGRISLDDAIAQVTEVMLHVAGKLTQNRLLHTVQGKPDTLADWLEAYKAIVAKRDIANSTRAVIRQRVAKISKAMGEHRMEAITTRVIAEHLATLSGTPRMQQATRSLLLDIFREAISEGWISSNPVQSTRSERVTTKRGRLSLDAFKTIHKWAQENQPAWAVRSYELALVTAQRREDIASMLFSQERDGQLYVIPKKVIKHGVKIAIPTSLRLNALGWTVADVIGRCRDNILSRHMIHHTAHAGKAKPGAKVREHTISQMFAKARDAVQITVPGKTPPSFHEIRSLALRLYADQGINAQALAGHKSADMTALYRDVRGDEWITVGELRTDSAQIPNTSK